VRSTEAIANLRAETRLAERRVMGGYLVSKKVDRWSQSENQYLARCCKIPVPKGYRKFPTVDEA